jgi:hypothetical protein
MGRRTGNDEGSSPQNSHRRTVGEQPRPLVTRLRVTQRTLQFVLGLIWMFDGLLKFQPHLLSPSFTSIVIRPMALGQPGLVGSTISHMANFLSHGATTWAALFGVIEIGIGVALLFPRAVKPALVVSFIWGIGVYLFGEGLGMVLTGHTSPLVGAPGAVCFYLLLGVMVWPKAGVATQGELDGADTSAAGQGAFGGKGAMVAWAAIWALEAIIWLFPSNRTGNSISNQMAAAASGEPGWYAHFLNSFGHAFAGAGTWVAVILAVTSLLIAVGPLVSRRPQTFIWLGIALALVYWVTGQALGELLTFGGTDPSNGPIVALIGLCVLPMIPERITESTLAAKFASLHPVGAWSAALAVVLVPLGVAILPASSNAAASPAASGSSMTGMSMSGSDSSMSGMSMHPKKSHSSHSGAARSMNMAAMAGLGVTAPNWKYTGPPLPAAEVSELDVTSARTDAGHKMQTPNCSKSPTSDQVLGATQYIQATSAAVAKYRDLSAAKAAGYVAITNPNYPVVHYLNAAYMNMSDLLNPNTVDSLVYATTPYGPVLVAAMYLMPSQGDGPMPFGCLVQWHAHTNLCTNDVTHQIDGFTPCRSGTSHFGATPMMTHVWQVPVAGGPLAIDPSDLQVVEAAIMAQQEGLAPTTPGAVPPAASASVG